MFSTNKIKLIRKVMHWWKCKFYGFLIYLQVREKPSISLVYIQILKWPSGLLLLKLRALPQSKWPQANGHVEFWNTEESYQLQNVTSHNVSDLISSNYDDFSILITFKNLFKPFKFYHFQTLKDKIYIWDIQWVFACSQ